MEAPKEINVESELSKVEFGLSSLQIDLSPMFQSPNSIKEKMDSLNEEKATKNAVLNKSCADFVNFSKCFLSYLGVSTYKADLTNTLAVALQTAVDSNKKCREILPNFSTSSYYSVYHKLWDSLVEKISYQKIDACTTRLNIEFERLTDFLESQPEDIKAIVYDAASVKEARNAFVVATTLPRVINKSGPDETYQIEKDLNLVWINFHNAYKQRKMQTPVPDEVNTKLRELLIIIRLIMPIARWRHCVIVRCLSDS